jgi:hypothetical protein
MRSHSGSRNRAIGAAAPALLALICSCATPTQPGHDPALMGVVLDAAGHVVPGARVVVSYPPPNAAMAATRMRQIARPSDLDPVPAPPPSRYAYVANNPCYLGAVRIEFSLPNPAHAEMVVRDRAQTVRRTVFKRDFAAGVFSVTWDGTDDNGAPLKPDVYVVHLNEVQGDSTFDFSLNLLMDRSDLTADYAIIADGAGRFSIPLSQLPIGERIDVIDQNGVSAGSYVIPNSVIVNATGPVGGVSSTGSTGVQLHSTTADADVTVRLP